jgi:hypothetical protein
VKKKPIRNLTTLSVLRGMRKLFKTPANIDRKNMASNVKGQWVEPFSKQAVCWCVVGAHTAIRGEYCAAGDNDGALAALERVVPFRRETTWAKFVAKVRHPRLLSVFDRAIAAEQARRKPSPRQHRIEE